MLYGFINLTTYRVPTISMHYTFVAAFLSHTERTGEKRLNAELYGLTYKKDFLVNSSYFFKQIDTHLF